MAALLPCRRKLHAHIPTPLTQATRFLHKDYKIDYFYWELCELSRRNVLVGWVLLIPTEDTFLRLVFALLLSIASFALLLSIHPYRRSEDNVLAVRLVRFQSMHCMACNFEPRLPDSKLCVAS